MIKVPKPFTVTSPLALIMQSFTSAMAAKNLLHDYMTMVLLDLALRLQQSSLALRLGHLLNFVSDPNVDSVVRQQRLEVIDMFWRWAGNGPVDPCVREAHFIFASHQAALGPVLSIEETRMLLTQVGRPWTIPYLVPRFFLGLEHAAALGFMIGATASAPEYPVVLERVAEGKEERHTPGAALVRWLEPYRNLRSDEPAILDPRISDYIATQAAKLGITWDEWLPTRTYCAYRLALVGWKEDIGARTGLPGWVITEAFEGMVSHTDALRYFDLSPRTCRRHHWDEEVAQYLEWENGGYQFGGSLAIPANA